MKTAISHIKKKYNLTDSNRKRIIRNLTLSDIIDLMETYSIECIIEEEKKRHVVREIKSPTNPL